jgi:hypothetical protein
VSDTLLLNFTGEPNYGPVQTRFVSNNEYLDWCKRMEPMISFDIVVQPGGYKVTFKTAAKDFPLDRYAAQEHGDTAPVV